MVKCERVIIIVMNRNRTGRFVRFYALQKKIAFWQLIKRASRFQFNFEGWQIRRHEREERDCLKSYPSKKNSVIK